MPRSPPTSSSPSGTRIWPRAVRARTKLPRPIARLPLLNLPAPVGRQPVAYLFDVGFTRDVWMHRIDIAHATGIPLDVDAAHDGRIVADIVAEWAGTHGEPFTLDLTGPAGGTFVAGIRTPREPAADAHARCHRVLADPRRARRRRRRAAPQAPALNRCTTPVHEPQEDHHGDPSRRDRRRHLPPVHVRARHRPDRLHVQPVPGRRRAAVALPHRPACDVPARLGGDRDHHSGRTACGGSRSVTSRPTSAAR